MCFLISLLVEVVKTKSAKVCESVILLCIVELPDNSKALNSNLTVGEGSLIVKKAVGKVADFVLSSLAELFFSLPDNVVLLSFRAALGLVLAVSVVESNLSRCVLDL